ncbi:MAG TPA: hypothetical protein VHN14_09390 [Kofleriaceae bacterium]|nr:hypothetical protein [Kofleriaceae bacterium]
MRNIALGYVLFLFFRLQRSTDVITADGHARSSVPLKLPLEGAEVAKVLVTFTRIEIYVDATQRWITVVDYGGAGRQFDLVTLQGGNTAELGAFDLEPAPIARFACR